MKEINLNNKIVLLEALEYIDRDLIAETVEDLKAPNMRQAPETKKFAVRKSIKYTLLLAACFIMLGAVIPIANYVIRHLPFFPGGNPVSDTTSETAEEPSVEITNEAEIPSGYDYVLTEEDIEMMNEAYRTTLDITGTYRFFKTPEETMSRHDSHFYFGKRGDTIIIWGGGSFSDRCCFVLGGYSFEFYTGRIMFFENGKLYYFEKAIEENILTDEEIKEFYDDYTEFYLPIARKPYIYLEFTPEVEKLTEEEMRSINDAYEAWQYGIYYEKGLELYKKVPDCEKYADQYVYSTIGGDPHRFFNEENFQDYHYYGKFGNKVILAVQGSANVHTKEIGNYKFIFNRSTSMYVYESGVFTELSEAYNSGAVTKNELAAIHERHLAYYNYFLEGYKEEPIPDKLKIIDSTKPSPIELTLDEKREIVWEYIESEYDLDYSYGVRCYGKFENLYAVMIDGPYDYSTEMRDENVAGYIFTFTSGQKMVIYCEGNFYSLLEAYERGIITKENVAAIEWDKTPQ